VLAVTTTFVGGYRDDERQGSMSNGLKLRKDKGYVVVNVESIDAIDACTDQEGNPLTVVIMKSGDKHLVQTRAPEKLITQVFGDNQ
jgi:hypothetical protein